MDATPEAVGPERSGSPEAVLDAATVTAINPLLASPPPAFLFSTPRYREPIGGPDGSVKVTDVPARFQSVTVMAVAPLRVSVVFSQTLGARSAVPLAARATRVAAAVARLMILAAPEAVGLAIDGLPEAVRVEPVGALTMYAMLAQLSPKMSHP